MPKDRANVVNQPSRSGSLGSELGCMDAVALVAFAFALISLLPLPAAWSQASVTSFELRPGVVVSLDKSEAYVMEPEGGIAAVDLNQGSARWRSTEAAKPLTLSGDLLVSQAEPKPGERALRIVTLNTSEDGRPELQQDIELPLGVNAMIGETPNRSFRAVARVVTGDAAVAWEYAERPLRGMRMGKEVLPGEAADEPEQEGPGRRALEEKEEEEEGQMEVASGSFRLDLKSGEVSAKRLGATAVERKALRAAQSAPPARVAGVPDPQFLSADGNHVMHPELVADDTVWDKYVWTVYDAGTGARLGEIKSHVRFAPFFVVDNKLLVTVSGPALRQTEQGLVEEPLQIKALDLTTGEVAWTKPIRDTANRQAPPP
jgi:hypothetical protein